MKFFSKKSLFFFICLNINNINAFADTNVVEIQLDNWSAEINLKSLEVVGKIEQNSLSIASPISHLLSDFKNLKKSSNIYSWEYPDKNISVQVKKENNFLVFKFTSKIPQIFEWPSTLTSTTSDTNNSEELVIPDGEGLLIPTQDPFWIAKIDKYDAYEYSMKEQLTLPLFANITDYNTVTYISDSSLNNTLKFNKNSDSIYIQQEHQFRQKDNLSPYIIKITVDPKQDFLAPGKHFRNLLSQKNELITLKQKASHNKEITKLYGAFHAYLWGTGRTEESLKLLKDLGIHSLWLGYDQNNHEKYKVTKKFIQSAKNYGYLVGPYDTWENIQNPKTADTQLSIFPNAWPIAAIIEEGGKRKPGFQNRGYEASSEYFAKQKPENRDLYLRLKNFKETGINSYFLDVDATGLLHDDYSPLHPMNAKKDMENRIKRLNYISKNEKLVLGSETAVYWAIPSLAFAHGNFSVFNSPHWQLSRQHKIYGRWYPTERPEFFFKTIKAPEDYENTRYNPLYRIPLFQYVYHDAIISTDRWEIPITKFSNLKTKRTLFEILYGIPSMWSLDLKLIKENKIDLKKYSDFFQIYHHKIAELPLTNFEFLTNDKFVQQAKYGNEIIVTANFSKINYKNIPKESVEVNYLKENKKVIYTP